MIQHGLYIWVSDYRHCSPNNKAHLATTSTWSRRYPFPACLYYIVIVMVTLLHHLHHLNGCRVIYSDPNFTLYHLLQLQFYRNSIFDIYSIKLHFSEHKPLRSHRITMPTHWFCKLGFCIFITSHPIRLHQTYHHRDTTQLIHVTSSFRLYLQ